MDLKEEIFKALDGKEYDDFTKIRWIYLYICEKFSYDTRYIFATNDMKENIYNTEIDITNVEEFEVVCYTLARILVDILSEFGYKCEIKKEIEKTLAHAYVLVRNNDYILKLDPTKRHDITRVKMKNTTIDFENLSNDEFFSDQLLDADKQIASDFDNLYFSDNSVVRTLKKILKSLDEEVLNNKLSDDEVFFKKIDILCDLINSRKDFSRYDDVDFYYSYLLKMSKINQKKVIIDNQITKINKFYVKPVVLFKRNDKSMKDIINISYVQYENLPPMFYLLKKENNNFKIREIFREEAIQILNEYKSPICQYLLEEASKKILTSNQNGIVFPK